jgi:NADPH:quinone reductase-like Zn-dependent oxidoreductase
MSTKAAAPGQKRGFLRRRSVRFMLLLGLAGVLLYVAFKPAPPPPFKGSGEPMQAVVYTEYGGPDVLRLQQVERPLPNDDQLLIKVRAAAANPLDWHFVEGKPYFVRLDEGLRKPASTRLGVDVAGDVVAVGKNVSRFKPGDAVFGTARGSFGEYVLAREVRLSPLPTGLTYEQAAAIPVAALTALQGLRDEGRIKPGQKVLINGASGGVGTFAVQIAKSFGADVTGVCSTRNVELVRTIGADRVVDYKKADFTTGAERYDLIFDTVGNRSLADIRRVMKLKGIYVNVGGGGPDADPWFGILKRPLQMWLTSMFSERQFTTFLAEINSEDLARMKALTEAHLVTPVIDRSYSLHEVPAAIAYLETGRARGKVVINVASGATRREGPVRSTSR